MQPEHRKSFMEDGELYFWTATIHQWRNLMHPNAYKDILVKSMQFLSEEHRVKVFGFVIMPNHLHLIWRTFKNKTKETPQGSFLKFTAHRFKQQLRSENPAALQAFKVSAHNKAYEFWQRDSLAIPLFTDAVSFQKLDYMHRNPMQPHWNLAASPVEYKYSSASFYMGGENLFPFLHHLWA